MPTKDMVSTSMMASQASVTSTVVDIPSSEMMVWSQRLQDMVDSTELPASAVESDQMVTYTEEYIKSLEISKRL